MRKVSITQHKYSSRFEIAEMKSYLHILPARDIVYSVLSRLINQVSHGSAFTRLPRLDSILP